jgi:AraC-like DNA-binding protein
MEKSQFYNYYVNFFKTTPKSDIINARIEKAKNLLTNQELKVNQVSEICGFKNISHFTRAFKKHTARSPRDYALQH